MLDVRGVYIAPKYKVFDRSATFYTVSIEIVSVRKALSELAAEITIEKLDGTYSFLKM